MNIRIGNGYDVHKFAKGRKLIIGGALIPYAEGLLGHSDADVLTHAIIDSLLGATKNGDIGALFPDSDDRYKNVNSLELLRNVDKLLKKDNYHIINIDATIIAQQPKMRPFIPIMEQNIAMCLQIDVGQVNIKATTEEGLGFTGALEGISASAVCLVNK